MGNRIVAAACQDSSGKHVVVSARHWDSLMVSITDTMKQKYGTGVDWSMAIEGFIDDQGTFLTRTEAWKVAEAAGQIIRRCGGDDVDGGTLYSENLY